MRPLFITALRDTVSHFLKFIYQYNKYILIILHFIHLAAKNILISNNKITYNNTIHTITFHFVFSIFPQSLLLVQMVLIMKKRISTPLMMENPVSSPMVPPIADNMSTNFAALSLMILSNVGVSK